MQTYMATIFKTLLRFVLIIAAVSFFSGHLSHASSVVQNTGRAYDKIIAAIPADSPPTYFKDEKTGKASGFAVDVLNEIARQAGFTVEYVYGEPWDGLIEMVRSGKADVVPSLTISSEREKLISFTAPVEVTPVGLTVTSNSKVTEIAPGMIIGTIKGSIPEKYMKDKYPDVKVMLFTDFQNVLFSLLAGRIDAAFVLNPNLMKVAYDAGLEDRIRHVSPPIYDAKRAIALKKGDTELLERLNNAIMVVTMSPEYQRIYQKWYGHPHLPFWTAHRVAEVVGLIFIITFAVMAFWRYRSLLRINCELRKSNEDRKKTEELLRESLRQIEDEKEKTKSILASIGDGISIQDMEFKVLYQNQVHKDMIGNHVGEYCYAGYEKRGSKCDGCPVAMSFADGQIHRTVRVVDLPEGRHYFDITTSPLRNAEGTIIGGIEAVRDVTMQKKAEAELRESRKFLQTIIDAEPECVKLLNADGTLIMMNRAGLDMIQADTLEQVKGKAACNFVSPEHREAFIKLIEDVFNGSSGSLIFDMLGLKGRRLWLETHAVPLRNDRDEIIALLGITRDITENKRLEDEKKRLEAQLIQAQKMEAIGQLAGGVAHDFNNLLSVIIGYGSLLRSKLQSDHVLKAYVDQILTSAEKSAAITRQLLAFSRKQTITLQEVDINRLIKDLQKFLKRLIGEDIEIHESLFDKEIIVKADPGQIEQVLINLFTNARDAMKDGGEIFISTGIVSVDKEYIAFYDLDQPGDYALITVTDTGTGMSEQTAQRIFEPFFTTKELGKGTGLGLAIVYGIIKQHKGHIKVYSELGKGTTFKIWLPIEICTSTIRSKSETEAAMTGGNETVLVAEDDETVRTLTRHVLENFGYTVIEAVDGDDAVEQFRKNINKVDLVLIDVIMPKKSGREVCDQIKRMKSDVKVLFTSGYTADIIGQKGILEDGLDFISKPVTPSTLLSKVRSVLNGAH